MTTVSSAHETSPLCSMLSSESFTVESAFLAAMLDRIHSLNADLRAQIDEITMRNRVKELWNDKLRALNDLMSQVAAAGKQGNELVTIDVPPGLLPYKDYVVVTAEDGSPTLVPADPPQALSNSYQYLFRLDDPRELKGQLAWARPFSVDGNGVCVTKTQHWEVAVAPFLGDYDAATGRYENGEFLGFRLSISSDMLSSALDTVRSRIDSLNTDGEIANLRLNDLFSKAQQAVTMTSNMRKKQDEGLMAIIQNMR